MGLPIAIGEVVEQIDGKLDEGARRGEWNGFVRAPGQRRVNRKRQFDGGNATATLRGLAQIAVKRPEHIPFVREAIERFSVVSRWGAALVLNAAALIEHDSDARRERLQQAVEAAAQLDRWSPHMWQKLGKHWQQHYAELRRLGYDSPESQAALQRARKRFGPAR